MDGASFVVPVRENVRGDKYLHMAKKIVPVIAILLLLGAAVWFFKLRSENGKHRGIFVSGNIEAVEVDLSFRISGQIKSLPIEEGDRVEKNQTVATLDTDTLLAQKGAAEAELANARAVLDELEEGTRSEQVERSRAALKAAESRFEFAKEDYERYKSLYKEKAISASMFDTKDTALKVASEEFRNAQQLVQELEKGPREQQIRAARAKLNRVEWDLKRIELDIEHSYLTTPVSGVVLVKSNEMGEVILPGATVTTVAALDEVWLKGYIGEIDLGKVKLQQKAIITTDSYPDKVYEGVVTYISSRAEFTPKNVQTKEERIKQVYRVKITIKNPNQELKIGMPAEGYILSDSAEHKNESQHVGKP
jgi:HlyD family secretion protein